LKVQKGSRSEDLGDRSPPTGSKGRAPVRFGAKLPEAYDETDKRMPITIPNFDHMVVVWG